MEIILQNPFSRCRSFIVQNDDGQNDDRIPPTFQIPPVFFHQWTFLVSLMKQIQASLMMQALSQSQVSKVIHNIIL